MNIKKDIFQKHKVQNHAISTPMNFQHYQNAFRTQKKTSLFISKMSKLKKISVAKSRS